MEKKLQRNEQEKMLAGVCAGLAEYFDVDVTWIRIAFVVAVLAGASGVLAYIILWIAVPAKPFVPGQYSADYRVYNENFTDYSADKSASNFSSENPMFKKKKSNTGRVIAGLLFICFGAFFLLDEFNIIPYWFDLGKLWPLVFIIPGILMVVKAQKKQPVNEPETVIEEATVIKEENTSSTTGTTNSTTHSDQPIV